MSANWNLFENDLKNLMQNGKVTNPKDLANAITNSYDTAVRTSLNKHNNYPILVNKRGLFLSLYAALLSIRNSFNLSIKIPNIDIPNLPNVNIPNLNIPAISLPGLVNIPGIPNLNIPQLPLIPNIDLPSIISLPNISLPKIPNIPHINMPSIPSISIPQLPKIPNVDLPNIPNIPMIPIPNILIKNIKFFAKLATAFVIGLKSYWSGAVLSFVPPPKGSLQITRNNVLFTGICKPPIFKLTTKIEEFIKEIIRIARNHMLTISGTTISLTNVGSNVVPKPYPWKGIK